MPRFVHVNVPRNGRIDASRDKIPAFELSIEGIFTFSVVGLLIHPEGSGNFCLYVHFEFDGFSPQRITVYYRGKRSNFLRRGPTAGRELFGAEEQYHNLREETYHLGFQGWEEIRSDIWMTG